MVRIDPQSLAASLRRLGSASNHEVVQVLEETVHACADLFGVNGSGLMIADEQNIMRYVAATDGPGRVLEHVQTETGQGPCVDCFVNNTVVTSDDLASEDRWPATSPVVVRHGVRSVLGVPVRLGGVSVGSLDVYRDKPHAWDESEAAALVRYSDVVETTLSAALAARHASELAEQLQHALDYRVVIERGVGYLMARGNVDAVTAFNLLRQSARTQRRKIAEVAQELLDTGALPNAHRPSPRSQG